MIPSIQEKTAKVKKVVNQYDSQLLLTLIFFAFIIYAFISTQLHSHFMTFGLDLGFFDEAIWKISRGKFPYSGIGCNWLLEDHFQVILYFFAPLYWIWNDARVILAAQAFLMVGAGFPLYFLAKKISRHVLFSFAVVTSYLFFIGTQFAVLNEFHQITVAPLLLALLYYGLQVNKVTLYWFSVIGLLITKEDLALLVAAIGLGLLFTQKHKLRGLITFIIGIAFFFFLLYFLIPAISVKGVYDHFDFGEAGYTPLDVIVKVITDPLFFIRSMIYPAVKLQTLFISFFTFSFLPLFSPASLLIPITEDFVTRFIYAGGQYTKWGLVNHHAAPSAMLLAIACIYGTRRLVSFQNGEKNILFTRYAVLLITATIVGDVYMKAPIHSLFKKQFYQKQQWMKDVEEVINRLPKDENISVSAQNSILPHIGHRDNVYRIPYGLNSLYMVVDLHDGPNKFAPLQYAEFTEFISELINSGRYLIVYQKNKAMLLRRNYKTDITKSKWYDRPEFCYYSFEER